MNGSLLRTVDIAGEKFDVGSDFHRRVHNSPIVAAQRLAHDLLQQQQSGNLILPGDLFHAENAQNWREAIDVTPAVQEALAILKVEYRHVLYVPGNHCLRRMEKTDNPWDSFDLPRGVLMPRANHPIIQKVGNARLLLGNIFYDGHFWKGASHDPQAFRELIDSTTDGSHLLRGSGSIPCYRAMTQTLAGALLPDIDALITHVPPTPLVATWRVGLPSESLPHGFPGRKYFDPIADAEGGRRMGGQSAQYFRDRLNTKAQMLGSNVFEEGLGAKTKDDITLVFGHHHRDENDVAFPHYRRVRLFSHQPVYKG